MFAIATILITTTLVHQDVRPVLWLNLNGDILVAGRPVTPQFNEGASKVETRDGVAYNFLGGTSGVLFGDNPALKLNGNLTVSAWIFPRSYAPNGAQAEILFRGDDRDGYDPYDFVLTSDGTVNFVIENEQSQGMGVKAEIPLNRWTHVTASLNAESGELAMWTNGVKVALAHTSKRPLLNLLPNFAPGVGVGNVQNDKGPHNQPFNGMIADLRLYSAVLTPDEAGFWGNRGSGGAQP